MAEKGMQVLLDCESADEILKNKGEDFYKVKNLIWIAYTVDHEVHNSLWHKVLDGLIGDAHVGVNQVTYGLHLTL